MILTLITHDRGAIEETSLQAFTLARAIAAGLGEPLHAAWIGDDPGIALLGSHGANTIHHVIHEELDDYGPDAWATAMAQLVELTEPSVVLAIGTDRGNEVMAHLGAIAGLPIVANVREVTAGEQWRLVRTRWGGSLLEETVVDTPRLLVTVAEHVVDATQSVTATEPEVVIFEPDLNEEHFVTKIVDRVVTTEGITLATAPVVVSGGRGVGSPEGFGPLEELASLLGGVVGCSRVVTNNGWRPHSDQVGQTGTVVAPDLYIACGISGAIQHWVGMMASKTILAINTDAEAPMVTKADYAVIGDVKAVVPAVVTEIERRAKAGG